MKKLLTTMAVLTVVATPAFAQYNAGGNIGEITYPADAYYNHNVPSARHWDAMNAYARAVPERRVPVQPPSRNEEICLDPAKGEID